MRSFAIAALLGSAVACTLAGQSLTEHAAAAAGGTIGTAAGKPLGTALGRIFGNVDNTSSKAAATAKPAKPVAKKPSPATSAGKTEEGKTEAKQEHTVTLGLAPSGGGNAGGGGGGSSHRVARREREAIEAEAPIAAPVAPTVTEPVVKQPTVQDLDSVTVGTSSSQLRSMLGTPESMVSIPDDDGHLRETLQYWANGEQIGTVHLDNGHVVSVQTNR